MKSPTQLVLTEESRKYLERISRSRTEASQRVQRARIVLAYVSGQQISAIARDIGCSRPRVYGTIRKASEFGAIAALDDLKGRRGRPRDITPEARVWLVDIACQKPKDLGYPHELWTRELLAKHVQKNCTAAGHGCLARVSAGTVTKILQANKLRPDKVRYYVERRDPDFEHKMIEVLHFYREVQLFREAEPEGDIRIGAYLSYDEKPGIQALEVKGSERPPVPCKHPQMYRDYEYVRHGTLSLMAGIDLITGEILARVEPRHRSCEFIEWLKMVDERYEENVRIRILLDNHSAHTSKETRQYLATVPGRFEFTFTPTHGSWLNLIENFFSKLARTILREMRVSSRDELRTRLYEAIDWLNQQPVVFKWKWGLEDLPVSSNA